MLYEKQIITVNNNELPATIYYIYENNSIGDTVFIRKKINYKTIDLPVISECLCVH